MALSQVEWDEAAREADALVRFLPRLDARLREHLDPSGEARCPAIRLHGVGPHGFLSWRPPCTEPSCPQHGLQRRRVDLTECLRLAKGRDVQFVRLPPDINYRSYSRQRDRKAFEKLVTIREASGTRHEFLLSPYRQTILGGSWPKPTRLRATAVPVLLAAKLWRPGIRIDPARGRGIESPNRGKVAKLDPCSDDELHEQLMNTTRNLFGDDARPVLDDVEREKRATTYNKLLEEHNYNDGL